MKRKIYVGVISFFALVLVGCSQNNDAQKDVTPVEDKKSQKNDRLVTDIKEGDFFVDSQWVEKQLKENDQTIVLEASYGEGETYQKKHLPNAVHMDTMEIETDENDWNILSPEECEKAFLEKGVTKDTPLVVYSEDINAASRVAFVAYWLGVEQVTILDGGLNAWEASGLPLEKKASKQVKAESFGVQVPNCSDYLIKTSPDFLVSQKENPEIVLASIRSWDEFMGKTSGYAYIENAGEPFGAVYAKSSKSSADVAYLVNNDGTMRDPKEIFSEWEEWGITSDKEVAFYCGTGWRAATAFFLCQQEGWERVRLFDGGWYDWDIHHQKEPSKYPVQIGDPRDKETVKVLD